MNKPFFILNGPNLNLLGEREPHIYGSTTLAQIQHRCETKADTLGLSIVFRQSNLEGELINWLHDARKAACGIIINPAGYSFTSVALLDALKASDLPVMEVHISNIHKREAIYHNSLVSKAATGVICGLGPLGYELALQALAYNLQAAA